MGYDESFIILFSIRSYHAILPLTSKEELLKTLPLDCCSKTRFLIANSSPQSCLVNYEGKCDVNDEEVKKQVKTKRQNK
jgi:hypothetical protein